MNFYISCKTYPHVREEKYRKGSSKNTKKEALSSGDLPEFWNLALHARAAKLGFVRGSPDCHNTIPLRVNVVCFHIFIAEMYNTKNNIHRKKSLRKYVRTFIHLYKSSKNQQHYTITQKWMSHKRILLAVTLYTIPCRVFRKILNFINIKSVLNEHFTRLA